MEGGLWNDLIISSIKSFTGISVVDLGRGVVMVRFKDGDGQEDSLVLQKNTFIKNKIY